MVINISGPVVMEFVFFCYLVVHFEDSGPNQSATITTQPRSDTLQRKQDGITEIHRQSSHTVTPTKFIPCAERVTANTDGMIAGHIQITRDEYVKVQPVGKTTVRLSCEWMQLMYSRFLELYSSCALIFTGNRIKKYASRKRRSHFWVGLAECKDKNCITLHFHIVKHKDTNVHIKLNGSKLQTSNFLRVISAPTC